jgi:hypothetical protein
LLHPQRAKGWGRERLRVVAMGWNEPLLVQLSGITLKVLNNVFFQTLAFELQKEKNDKRTRNLTLTKPRSLEEEIYGYDINVGLVTPSVTNNGN